MELKPCPFCGGNGKLKTGVTSYCPPDPKAYVFCEKCGSSGRIFEDIDRDGQFVLRAAEAWNRRTK